VGGAAAGSIGGAVNTGVVYMISLGALSSTTPANPINVSTFQTSNQAVVLAGINAGDLTGFSVADAGDVSHVSGGTRVDALLIGAPNFGANTGWAYLVYGGSRLPGLATTTNNARFINLANLNGAGGKKPLPRAA